MDYVVQIGVHNLYLGNKVKFFFFKTFCFTLVTEDVCIVAVKFTLGLSHLDAEIHNLFAQLVSFTLSFPGFRLLEGYKGVVFVTSSLYKGFKFINR